MVQVRTENPKLTTTKVPKLTDLFAPCPICGGTTDIDFHGYTFCHSCQQEWTLTREAMMHNENAIKAPPIGINSNSSLPVDTPDKVDRVKRTHHRERQSRFPSLHSLMSTISGKHSKLRRLFVVFRDIKR